MPSPCPTEAELAALLAGESSDAAREALQQHLEECPACRQRLDARAGGGSGWLSGAREFVKARAAKRSGEAAEGDPPRPASTIAIRDLQAASLAGGPMVEGTMIGRYKILEQVGEGGFGAVYVAEQSEPVKRRVALKIIKLGMDTKQVVARFEAERQALALMEHPNIAKVLDAGTTDSGRPFFVMELVRGIKITDYCDQNNLSTAGRLGLFVQVCQAIQHAHQKGIIHRDIKPSNILVTLHDGVPVPKVIDFGIAKATQGTLTDKTVYTRLHEFIGTPAYMSPEQAEMTGLDIDTRSDIYSLGVLLYELLTGETPFDSRRLVQAGLDEIRRIIRQEEPPRPSIRLSKLAAAEQTTAARRRQCEPPKLIHLLRGDLDWIVMKCLEKDRTRRYETASHFGSDILRYLNNEPVVACPPSNFYAFRKFVRRNRLLFACGASITLILLLAVLISALAAKRARRSERDAINAKAGESKLRVEADLSRVRAETLETKARRQSMHLKVNAGTHLLEENNPFEAGLYFVSALADARGEEETRAHRIRLGMLLEDQPELKEMIEIPPDSIVSRDWRFAAEIDHDDPRTLRIFSTADGSASTMQAPERIRRLVFSPHAELFAAAGDDHLRLGVPARASWTAVTIPLKGESLTATTFDTAGRRIATSYFWPSAEKKSAWKVSVWDCETGNQEFETIRDSKPIQLAFAQSDLIFAQANGDFWYWKSGAKDLTPLKHPLGTKLRPWELAVSRDGTLVAASSEGSIYVWNVASGELAAPPVTLQRAPTVVAMEFSPDNEQILAGIADLTGKAIPGMFIRWGGHRWGGNSEAEVTTVLHNGRIRQVGFNDKGDEAFTESEEGLLKVWSLKKAPRLARWSSDPAFHPVLGNSNTVALVDRGHGRAAVIDTASGREKQILEFNAKIGKAVFSMDDSLIALIGTDGNVKVFAATNGQAILSLKNLGTVYDVVFRNKNQEVLIWNLEEIRFLNVTTGETSEPPLRINVVDMYWRFAFSGDGSRAAVHTKEGVVEVWDLATRQVTGTLRHERYLMDIRFSPSGNYLATASADRTVRIWRAQDGKPLSQPLPHGWRVVRVCFSPDERFLASGGVDRTARVWSVPAGEPVGTPLIHGRIGGLEDLSFSADGQFLATSAMDSHARLWDIRAGGEFVFRSARTGRFVAKLTPDAKRLLTESELRQITPAEAPVERLMERFEIVSGLRLLENGATEPIKNEHLIQMWKRWKNR